MPPFTFRAPLVLSALCLLCWVLLWRWYALDALIDQPLYALDKVPGHFDAPQLRATALLFLGLSLLYGAQIWLLRRAPLSRAALTISGIGVAGVAIFSVLMFPIGAVDVFYYACELKLRFFYGENPYLTPFTPRYSTDNFAPYAAFTATTVAYGPAWFWSSWAPGALTGYRNLEAMLLGYKIWSALWVLGCGALIWTLTRRERPLLSVGIWLLNPFVWVEAVVNAHNDVMMTLWLLAAVWMARNPKSRGAWTALPFLALAIATKPSAAPLAWVFVVWMARAGWTARPILISAFLAIALAVALAAPFWAGVPTLDGWRAGVATSVGMGTGSPVSLALEWLTGRGATPETLALVRPVAMLILVALTLISPWIVRRFESNLALVLGLVYLLAGSLFAWYLLPIMALLALRPRRGALIYLLGGSLLALQFSPLGVWAWFNSPFAGQALWIHAWEFGMLGAPLLIWMASALGRPRRERV